MATGAEPAAWREMITATSDATLTPLKAAAGSHSFQWGDSPFSGCPRSSIMITNRNSTMMAPAYRITSKTATSGAISR